MLYYAQWIGGCFVHDIQYMIKEEEENIGWFYA